MGFGKSSYWTRKGLYTYTSPSEVKAMLTFLDKDRIKLLLCGKKKPKTNIKEVFTSFKDLLLNYY